MNGWDWDDVSDYVWCGQCWDGGCSKCYYENYEDYGW